MRSDRFRKVTGSPLDSVVEGLQASKRAGFHPIKINMVALKGIAAEFLHSC